MVKDYLVKVRLDAFEADTWAVDDGVVELVLSIGGDDAFSALESAAIALSQMTHFVAVKEDNE